MYLLQKTLVHKIFELVNLSHEKKKINLFCSSPTWFEVFSAFQSSLSRCQTIQKKLRRQAAHICFDPKNKSCFALFRANIRKARIVQMA